MSMTACNENPRQFKLTVHGYKYIYRKASRPEAHMGMIPPEALLKGIGLTPQQQTLQWHYFIDNAIAPSDPVESSGYSSGAPQGGSCPCAPLDEVLR